MRNHSIPIFILSIAPRARALHSLHTPARAFLLTPSLPLFSLLKKKEKVCGRGRQESKMARSQMKSTTFSGPYQLLT